MSDHQTSTTSLSVVFLGIVSITLSIICGYWFIRDRVRNVERNALLDKLRRLLVRRIPFIGQTWHFGGSPERLFRILNETLTKLETPFVIWFGDVPTVHLTNLRDIEEVSKICVSRNTYGLIEGTLEDGIIAQNHEKWRRTRRLMTPAFGLVMLTQYLHVFNQQGKLLVDLLRPNALREEFFDVWPFLINANIDIITENMMGVQPDCQRNQGNEYSEAFLKIMFVTLNRLINPFLWPPFIFGIYARFIGLIEDIKTLHEYPRKAIKEALIHKVNVIEYRERTSLSSVQNIPKHMIDILLADHIKDARSMSEEQIKSEMIHLLAAGSETTAIGVAFLMSMFGIHQDKQEMAYREIVNVVQEDRQITMDDLNELQYLEQCIKETLRLFSIVPLTYRNTQHALTLPSGDTVPDDVPVVLHLKSIHENPAYYPNPNQWNPDNFGAERVKSRPPNSFAPFGLGSRSCIGSKYAMISMKVQASYLLRSYHVFSAKKKFDDIVINQDILRRSREGYHLKLRARKLPATIENEAAAAKTM